MHSLADPKSQTVQEVWLATLYLFCCWSTGTAGLRGVMGFGFNRMNEVVVQQTTQGFCRYLQEQAGDKLKSRGIAIGGSTHLLKIASSAARTKLTRTAVCNVLFSFCRI